ncbi:uncharacterized protein LOC143018302 isoform X2 [Oratosquilla oratoria]|uniref:uncharacterized protein LOC143018302 isoform X2 n=1 Tax=Oratosquilla oratoria TaxID=337810 RepID=UPI003F76027D
MTEVKTTPFEARNRKGVVIFPPTLLLKFPQQHLVNQDLILGSQFLPLLTVSSAMDNASSKGIVPANVGVLRCRKCGADFAQVREALSHYKLHVFESHKEYFTVVAGGSCPLRGCPVESSKPHSIHFHCSYCTYSTAEILDLPLHMEKGHLAFYREVSLVLRGDDVQRTKVYACGECGIKIQGTVSIVQHLLAHDSGSEHSGKTVTNGYTPITVIEARANSASSDSKDENIDSVMDCSQDSGSVENSEEKNNSVVHMKIWTSGNSMMQENGSEGITVKDNLLGIEIHPVNSSLDILNENDSDVSEGHYEISPEGHHINQEQMQVELNPMDILTTLMEEDHKSEFPMFPQEHFLSALQNPARYQVPHAMSMNQFEYSNGYANDGYEDYNSLEGYPEDDNDEQTLEDMVEGSQGEGLENAGIYPCDVCGEQFKFQHQLIGHTRQVHQGMPLPFQCQICGQDFAALYELKRHQLSHSGANIYRCQVCNQGFPDRATLKTHTASHGSLWKKGQPCPQPTAWVRSNAASGVGEHACKCELCGKEFPSRSELTKHAVKYQGTCNPKKNDGPKCATCNEELPSLEALKEHRKTAHPAADASPSNPKKGFSCDYCGKTFNCRSNLRDHLVVHTGEKPYPCDICGKAFSFIHNMKTHRLTHNEGRNEVCPYCDKAYKSKISLYYHMKKGNCKGLSSKEVPEGYHRCTECLQMFASMERYKAHKDKGHCQVSHRCDQCGLKCSSDEKLQKHIKKKQCHSNTKETKPTQRKKKPPREKSEKEREREEIICEKCNYTKDCCCTFSCDTCGKRIFSILAFTLHVERTCPVIKQRRERIREAIMEKKRRKEQAWEEQSIKQTLENMSAANREDSAYDFMVNHSSSLLKESKSKTEEDEDSNSGSLTDLSTFTTPNILSTPVAEGTDE